ncbi:hypothetical protein B0T18DRAFT_486617 [Schizothecium vesticola]|uniref:Uncharacterized protein n=1 Tax=Schizothecium vesticola TaxID=314040 RepID=A0AA40F6R2_9PEZI|nr:hypothetical protein B0T18DRAFT_486617 [Schizothecium vesticola]
MPQILNPPPSPLQKVSPEPPHKSLSTSLSAQQSEIGMRVQTMLRKKATLVAYVGLHGPGFQKEGLRAIDAIFLRDDARRKGPWFPTPTPRHPPALVVVLAQEVRYQTSERGASRGHCLSTQIFSTKSDGSGCRIPRGRSLWAMAELLGRLCGVSLFAAQSPRPLYDRLGLPAE